MIVNLFHWTRKLKVDAFLQLLNEQFHKNIQTSSSLYRAEVRDLFHEQFLIGDIRACEVKIRASDIPNYEPIQGWQPIAGLFNCIDTALWNDERFVDKLLVNGLSDVDKEKLFDLRMRLSKLFHSSLLEI